ncbi:MAG: type II secretion system F family protein [Planctomyces sp.]
MDLTTILPYSIFVAVTAGFWTASSLLLRRSTRTSARLDALRNPLLRQRRDPVLSAARMNAMSSLVERAAPALSRALEPKSETEQSLLRVRLANAGFSRPTAVRNFLAIKALSLGLGAVLGLMWISLRSAWAGHAWMIPVVLASALFYAPEIILSFIRSGRQDKIFLQLPDALDLLVVCVEAGLGLDQGMRRVAEELNQGAPEVCEELATANMQLQMGKPRREVLHDLGIRTGVDDVKGLAAILIQADRFGSSIGQALRVHSETMRVKRRQLAEEKAQQTAVKMIFPLVLFIFPGLFVVLVGPAAIQLMNNLVE